MTEYELHKDLFEALGISENSELFNLNINIIGGTVEVIYPDYWTHFTIKDSHYFMTIVKPPYFFDFIHALWSIQEIKMYHQDDSSFPLIVKYFSDKFLNCKEEKSIYDHLMDVRSDTMNKFNINSQFRVDITDLGKGSFKLNGFKINVHTINETKYGVLDS